MLRIEDILIALILVLSESKTAHFASPFIKTTLISVLWSVSMYCQ